MLLSINIRSSVAVFLQIENHIQFGIASGQLKAGDQLPSVGELSEHLGVNSNTVAKAYRDLEVMGLIHARRGVGFYVKKGAETKCRELCRRRITARLYEAVTEARAAGMTSKELKQVVNKSYSSDVGPYGPTPGFVNALAKSKTSRK